MSNKLKNVLFHFFGISLFVCGLALSIWLGNLAALPQKPGSLASIAIIIFFFIIYNLLTMGFISHTVLDGKKTILNYVFYLKDYVNIKWVCHSELGYFPTIIGKRKLTIYEQGIFSINKLTSISTDDTSIERISNMVKEHLDWVYKNLLQDAKEVEVLKAKQNEIKKWDGYLDVPTRRDKKIDELLK
jgi:hypothetical protein